MTLRETQTRRVLALVVIASTAPSVVTVLTSGRGSNIVATTGSMGGVARVVSLALIAAIIMYAAKLIFVPGGRSVTKSQAGYVIALAPWAVTILLTVVAGEGLSPGNFAYPAVVTALWFIGARFTDARLGGWILLVALCSMGLALIAPSLGFLTGYQGQVVTPEKTILGGPLLAGPFNHSNTLGSILALGGVFAFALPRHIRWVAIALVSVALLWTASRTSTAAFGTAIVLVLILKSAPKAAAAIVPLGALAAVGLMVYLPLTNNDPYAFSDRGQIWYASLLAADTHPWFGNGIGWYGEIAQVYNNLLPQAFHAHNLFVHWYTTGGILLLVVIAVFLWRAVRIAAQQAAAGQPLAAAYLTTFLVLAIFEVNISFRDVTPLFWCAVVPMALLVMQPMLKKASSEPRFGVIRPSVEATPHSEARLQRKRSTSQ